MRHIKLYEDFVNEIFKYKNDVDKNAIKLYNQMLKDSDRTVEAVDGLGGIVLSEDNKINLAGIDFKYDYAVLKSLGFMEVGIEYPYGGSKHEKGYKQAFAKSKKLRNKKEQNILNPKYFTVIFLTLDTKANIKELLLSNKNFFINLLKHELNHVIEFYFNRNNLRAKEIAADRDKVSNFRFRVLNKSKNKKDSNLLGQVIYSFYLGQEYIANKALGTDIKNLKHLADSIKWFNSFNKSYDKFLNVIYDIFKNKIQSFKYGVLSEQGAEQDVIAYRKAYITKFMIDNNYNLKNRKTLLKLIDKYYLLKSDDWNEQDIIADAFDKIINKKDIVNSIFIEHLGIGIDDLYRILLKRI